ncbi:MAG TPA: DUF3566 domain-containing protein [Micromonospora sp.]|nr:DUF3566 domain-containing protein [Micromonospora sp.]
MTETQAKSGTAEAPANPVDEEGAEPPATGRTAVGRATVPAEAASPKFTRAPGMAPPPDKPSTDEGSGAAEPSSGGGSVAVATPPTAAPTPAAAAPTPADTAAPTGDAAVAGGAGQVGAPPPAVPRVPPAVGAARVAEAVRAARSTVSSAASRGPRRARLNIKRIDPWSVMKFSFAVSFVLFIVVIVATSVLYLALDAMGVFESINGSLTEMISAGGGQEPGSFRITAFGVIGTSALVGLVNVVLFTALATLGAFIYNVCADLVGGIEITLAERD